MVAAKEEIGVLQSLAWVWLSTKGLGKRHFVMGTSEAVKKTPPPPKLVTTNKALKLAEQWVNNMSKCLEDESIEEMEGRPSRLGLGAKVPRQSKAGFLNDPVERKLQAKFAKKRKDIRSSEEISPSPGDGYNNDEDEDEESESRTSAFVRRKVVPLIPPLQAKKKLK